MNENERAKLMAQMEQASAGLRDTLAPALFSLYKALKFQGFSEEQSFELTKQYMYTLLIGK